MRNVLSTVPRTLAHGENTSMTIAKSLTSLTTALSLLVILETRLNISIKTFLNNLKFNVMIPNVDSSKKGYF